MTTQEYIGIMAIYAAYIALNVINLVVIVGKVSDIMIRKFDIILLVLIAGNSLLSCLIILSLKALKAQLP